MLRFYVVAATNPAYWRRRIRSFSEPALFACVGKGATQASKHLSAALSEVGVPNRWIPLSRYPALLESLLCMSSQTHNPLHELLHNVVSLVLDANEADIRRLRAYLCEEGVIEKVTYFFPERTVPERLFARSHEEIEVWMEADQELRQDLTLASQWVPCYILPTLP
ncbi:MAG: hypothetical protein RMK19_06915 [Bacteroidia bacterium]|nr:hypothetical protein [Bacteroidia bacterium]MDW8015727.1 hypothetical protein [Bacteroidia bacterium]